MAVDATSGAGGLRVDPAEFDAYYFAPQKCFACDGGLWVALLSPAALERIGADRRLRAVGPGVPGPHHRPRQLAAGPDLQHAGAGHHLPPRRAGRLDERQRRAGVLGRALRPLGRDPLHLGREVRTSPGRSSTRPRTAATSWAPSTSSTRSTPATVAAVLRANGIVDTEPYRKLGRNQLRIAMFPAIEPDDVAALCACITHVVGALAQ